MKKQSLLTMVLSLSLVGTVGIGATLSYLSSTTEVMTNTFSIGHVKVIQDEAVWDDVNNVAKSVRTSTGNSYTDITPGDTLAKDPTATVIGGSANCYVFMQLSGADELESKQFDFGDISESWELVKAENTSAKLDGLYQYKNNATNDIVKKSTENQKLPALFKNVSYSIQAEELASGVTLNDVTIKTCAVQADNITASDALNAALTEIAE